MKAKARDGHATIITRVTPPYIFLLWNYVFLHAPYFRAIVLAPSLHRESTDSVIDRHTILVVCSTFPQISGDEDVFTYNITNLSPETNYSVQVCQTVLYPCGTCTVNFFTPAARGNHMLCLLIYYRELIFV